MGDSFDPADAVNTNQRIDPLRAGERGGSFTTRTSFMTPPEMTRSLRVLILTFALADCRGSSTTVSDQPHATDRYARLLRRQLTDSDPMMVHRAISCEVGRIAAIFGGAETKRRLKPVRDSIVRSNRRRDYQIDSILASHTFEVSGPLCDSLNAIADREVPLKPISTSMDSSRRERPGNRNHMRLSG
jgi:hypothetical protein